MASYTISELLALKTHSCDAKYRFVADKMRAMSTRHPTRQKFQRSQPVQRVWIQPKKVVKPRKARTAEGDFCAMLNKLAPGNAETLVPQVVEIITAQPDFVDKLHEAACLNSHSLVTYGQVVNALSQEERSSFALRAIELTVTEQSWEMTTTEQQAFQDARQQIRANTASAAVIEEQELIMLKYAKIKRHAIGNMKVLETLCANNGLSKNQIKKCMSYLTIDLNERKLELLLLFVTARTYTKLARDRRNLKAWLQRVAQDKKNPARLRFATLDLLDTLNT